MIFFYNLNYKKMELIADLEQMVHSYLTLEDIIIYFAQNSVYRDVLISKYYTPLYPHLSNAHIPGDYYTIKYAIGKDYMPCKTDLEILAQYGHLKIVQYYLDVLQISPTVQAIENASINNHLSVLKHFMNLDINYTELEYILELVAKKGHLAIYKYFISCGFGASSDDLISACQYNHLNLVKYLIKDCKLLPISEYIEYASACGSYDVLKYLVSLGLQPSIDSLYNACEGGYIKVVWYLLNMGIKPISKCLTIAIHNHHFKIVMILAYILQIEDIHICTATMYGNLEALKLFKNLGVSLSTFEKSKAVKIAYKAFNSLPILKFLIDNGIYFDSDILNEGIEICIEEDSIQYLRSLKL
jgi:hypothetical protein